ncbi:PAS domain-containing protein [Pannus brasiliensis CCIBt3594]|uniref:histidine kinase n=1 Tax=Pannus brasiliensis CCIBt3594 TaxID=1427578 RepID=A0AAW9QRT4_9CHRO
MPASLPNFFSARPFIPHGHCYLWRTELVGLHLIADGLIALAYFSIPLLLLYFVRQRKDVPFPSIFWLFAAFIIACGTTHLIAVWTLWHPIYWVSGTIKAITAFVSLYTASELYTVIPKALALRSPEELAAEIRQRERAEKALAESERCFRGIFDQTFQFIGLMKPDGTLIEANRTALEFGGLEALEAIDRPLWDTYWFLTPEVDRERIRSSVERAARGEFIRYEISVQGAGGRLVPIDFSLKPIFNDSGEVELIIPEGRDITDLKRVEAEIRQLNAELEERVKRRTQQLEASNREKEEALDRERQARQQAEISEQRFRVSQELSLDAFTILRAIRDERGEIVDFRWDYANPMAGKLLRLPPDALIGERLLDKFPGNKTDSELFDRYVRVVETGEPHDIELFYNSEDLIGWYRNMAVKLEDGVAVFFTDITERKHAELALQESEHRYATLARLSPVGIFRCDREGACFYVNDRWTKMTGFSAGSAIGFGWTDVLHPDDRPRVVRNWQIAVERNEPFRAEYRVRGPDGSSVWVLGQALPEKSDEDVVISYVGTITDISERVEVERELQERSRELREVNQILTRTTNLIRKRNEELDRFAYIVSHDLKAPLRAIANLSEWIEEDLDGQLPAENRRQMTLLRSRVHRMEALINGLLEYSRIGRDSVEIETVNVGTLLAETIDSIDPPEPFSIVLPENPPVFSGKPLFLRQVLANLITNAIKHHDKDTGRVEIGAIEDENFIEFTVSDDGPGISPEYHERIFGIFQTLGNGENPSSTGIGLTIVKKIIEGEGGSIALESVPGEGSCFRFTWPKQPKTDTD